jgi:hypothetical protein
MIETVSTLRDAMNKLHGEVGKICARVPCLTSGCGKKTCSNCYFHLAEILTVHLVRSARCVVPISSLSAPTVGF